MLSKLTLYWLTHCYAIICSVVIAAGDYLALLGYAGKTVLMDEDGII